MKTYGKGDNKITKRQHLEQVAKSVGKKFQCLEEPKVPQAGMKIWQAFWVLSSRRCSIGGFGDDTSPITFSEIESYCKLMAVTFRPIEIEIILIMDEKFLKFRRDGFSNTSN